MKPFAWAILIAIGFAALGVVFGVAGIFIAPILGFIAILALILWVADRRARGEPPIE